MNLTLNEMPQGLVAFKSRNLFRRIISFRYLITIFEKSTGKENMRVLNIEIPPKMLSDIFEKRNHDWSFCDHHHDH